MKRKLTTEFFNEAANATLIAFANEINIGADGWAMICPFGDHTSTALHVTTDGKLKREASIQRITPTTGAQMVTQFHNERKGLRKFFKGVNIYVGHPDMPGMEKRYPDKEPKGVFADMEAREDGVYGLPVFTNEGSEIVEKKTLRAFSGRLVDCVPDGEKDGVKVYAPTRIASVGLTNNPHLPVHFFNADDTLADEAEKQPQPQNTTMKKKLLAVCTLLGIQFANEADDAQTEAALDQVNAKVTQFGNERTTIRQKLHALATAVGLQFANEAALPDAAVVIAQVEEKVKPVLADNTRLSGEVATLRTQFANERAARIDDLVKHGLTAGTITGAEEADWRRRLGNTAEFANEATAFSKLTPKVKTTVITIKRGDRENQVDLADAKGRREFINEVQTELAAELKLHPVKDAKRISAIAAQRHPALFRDVPHVEIKYPGSKK